jgi:hypothetical protein
MLTQYGQTIQMSGNGLAKCPYIYKEQYDVGDLITVAFSGKSAVVQILSVTEHWIFGNYNIQFSFGKPQNNLSEQLQLMLRKIQSASNKEKATESVKWYNVANVNSMSASDVTFNTIGFTGTLTANKTFTFYLDNEKTGAKSYNIYVKNLSGNFTLTLTTGRSGKTNYVLKGGVNLTGRILVDDEGNITSQSVTATSVIESGNNQPATSGGVADTIQGVISLPTDAVLHYSFDEVPDYPDGTAIEKHIKDFTSVPSGWGSNNRGELSVANGEFINTVTDGKEAWFRRYRSTAYTNIIVKAKVRCNVPCTIQLAYSNGTKYVVLQQYTQTEVNRDYILTGFISSTNFINIMVYVPSVTDFEAILSEIYIGDGSYSTPIIDNANGQNNATNNGGIAVQGVSGKGIRLFNGKYVEIKSGFNITPNFSLSTWFNLKSVGGSNYGHIFRNPNILSVVLSAGKNINVYMFDKDGVALLNDVRIINFTESGFINLVITRNGTTFNAYINGEKKYNTTLANDTIRTNAGTFTLGSSTGTIDFIQDDFLIFNRALSDTEVLALYLNKANTPKYYDINNYNLKQIKNITAQSTDFADFQSRMAGLATRSLQLIEPTEDER